MTINLKKTIKWGLIIFAVFLYLKFGVVIPEKPSKTRIDQINSSARMTYLGESIQKYMLNHNGKKPNRLVDLIEDPELCADMQMVFRYPHHSVDKGDRIITNNVNLAEKYSDYILSTNSGSDILVYEKPNLWKDESVAVYLKNQGTMRMTNNDFQELLKTHK